MALQDEVGLFAKEVKDGRLSGAVETLQKVAAEKDRASKDLLAERSAKPVQILFNFHATLEGRIAPVIMKLPHPFHPKLSRVCVIVQDPKSEWRDLLAAVPDLCAVCKVMSIATLKKMRDDIKWKSKLATDYDLFLADARTAHMLPGLLGQKFFAKKKLPVELRFTKSNFVSKIREALQCTFLRIPRGRECRVVIGTLDMEATDLVENARSVMDGAEKYFLRSGGRYSSRILRVSLDSPAQTDLPPLPLFYHPLQKELFASGFSEQQKKSKAS